MWELDHKEDWALKNWYFQIVVLKNTLESPLDSKEIKPVKPKRTEPWTSIGRTDAETEAPMLWSPVLKSWLTGKDPNIDKTEGKRRQGQQRIRWIESITNSVNMSLGKLQEMVKDREAQHAVVQGTAKSRTWLSEWTTTTSWRQRICIFAP